MISNNWDADFYQNKHSFVTAYGEDMVEILSPQAGEIILDLGCGSGELCAKIANSGASVYGLDYSENMINKALLKHPKLNFLQHDAALAFPYKFQFDAVFSNAALHWMPNPEVVIENIAKSLKSKARFVFEMGGKGNISKVLNVIKLAANKYDIDELPIYNYFPSISEYSSILERNDFVVKYALLFERPTQLEGEDGLKNWILMFRNSVLDKIPLSCHQDFFQQVENLARDELYKDGCWFADYVRLRMIAIRN